MDGPQDKFSDVIKTYIDIGNWQEFELLGIVQYVWMKSFESPFTP